MACIRKRRGQWVADYRDGGGVRRWRTFGTKRNAEDFLAKTIPEVRQGTRAGAGDHNRHGLCRAVAPPHRQHDQTTDLGELRQYVAAAPAAGVRRLASPTAQ